MPDKHLIETGRIVNTHGVKGEVKVESWADSPAALAALHTLWLNGEAKTVVSARVHAGYVIVKLAGVDTVEAAMALKGKTLYAARADIAMDKDAIFVQDLIGLPVFTEDGQDLGRLTEVLEYPAGRIFVVKGETEHLIPEKGDFLRDFDLVNGRITVRLIEGM